MIWELAKIFISGACIGAAVALLLDECYDYHKHPEQHLKLSDLLKPSHELAIAILIALSIFFAVV